MAGSFDLVRQIKECGYDKSWRISVRVPRLWRVPAFNDRQQKPMLEMAMIDEKCTRIACSIKSQHVKFFEDVLMEGKVYIISNFEVFKNAVRFKPTRHDCRILFKRETQVGQIEDDCIPSNSFDFIPNSVILSQLKEDCYLVDVIWLLRAKENICTHPKDGKNLKYIKLELDDLESNQNIQCTLWEDYAIEFDRHVKQNPATEYIVLLQLGKLKLYQGRMGVSNTNYTSKLYINEDFIEVKQFRQRPCHIDSPAVTQVTELQNDPSYSLEDEFLKENLYKPICDLKEANEGDRATFITFGTVKDIETEYSWWYKACKQCFQGLKEHTRSFHCKKCNSYPNTFNPRYSIRLRVEDETGSATFIVYLREAAKYLNMSANDLRAAHLARGGQKKDYPGEINAFMEKKFLFKVSVKIDDLNSFQPSVITILKLCSDEAVISAFKEKYKINDLGFLPDNSDLLSNFPDCSDLNKETFSQSCENAGDTDVANSCTPSKTIGEHQVSKSYTPTNTKGQEFWITKPSDSSPDDCHQSSTKLRKVLKDHED